MSGLTEPGQGGARVDSKRTTRWIGWSLSAVPVVMLVFSASLKIVATPQVLTLFVDQLGYPRPLLGKLAVLELTCVALYLIPRTSIMGAILLTGYLGGAITTNLRVGQPFFIQTLLALLVWGGLYLREDRLHALLPLRDATGKSP